MTHLLLQIVLYTVLLSAGGFVGLWMAFAAQD